MTRAEFIARIAFVLGNMPSDDPAYVRIPTALTEGISQLVLMGVKHERSVRDRLNLFPELSTSWTSLVTVAHQAYVAMPADKIAINDVQSYDRATGTPNLSSNTLRPLKRSNKRQWGIFDKTIEGFPNFWMTEKDDKLWVYPTPTVASDPTLGYLTFLELWGWKRDVNFVTVTADATVPLIDKMWDPAIVQMSCYLLAVDLGWGSEAQAYFAAAETFVDNAIDKTALGEEEDDSPVQLTGWFTSRDDVYS